MTLCLSMLLNRLNYSGSFILSLERGKKCSQDLSHIYADNFKIYHHNTFDYLRLRFKLDKINQKKNLTVKRFSS